MPLFSHADFNEDNTTRLRVIIMPQIKRPPLTAFNQLLINEKVVFNKLLNEYIQKLGEDWNETILRDFNEIATTEIFNDTFDASKHKVAIKNETFSLALTDEQREFFADKPEELSKISSMGFVIEEKPLPIIC